MVDPGVAVFRDTDFVGMPRSLVMAWCQDRDVEISWIEGQVTVRIEPGIIVWFSPGGPADEDEDIVGTIGEGW